MADRIFYSRSATVTDWKCQRARFLNYEWEGRGLSPDTTALPLAMGIMIHDSMAAIAAGIPIDKIASVGRTQLWEQLISTDNPTEEALYFAEEQCALAEGLIRGYYRHIWPRLMAEYDIVSVEEELLYPHDSMGRHDPSSNVIFMAKPDLLLRNKESGDLLYWELKSTSSTKDQWVTSWQYAVQLHSTVRAIETAIGEKVERVIVQGLAKGYAAYGKQSSIMCYAYHKPGQPPFVKDIWAVEYKAGLKKFPIWKKEGGVKQWVEEMPEALLSQQFPQSMPIFINPDLVDNFFRQRYLREKTIRESRTWLLDPNVAIEEKQQIMDANFPQNFEACSPSFGSGCDFKRLCHGAVANPLTAGFNLRTSHHLADRVPEEPVDNQLPS